MEENKKIRLLLVSNENLEEWAISLNHLIKKNQLPIEPSYESPLPFDDLINEVKAKDYDVLLIHFSNVSKEDMQELRKTFPKKILIGATAGYAPNFYYDNKELKKYFDKVVDTRDLLGGFFEFSGDYLRDLLKTYGLLK